MKYSNIVKFNFKEGMSKIAVQEKLDVIKCPVSCFCQEEEEIFCERTLRYRIRIRVESYVRHISPTATLEEDL